MKSCRLLFLFFHFIFFVEGFSAQAPITKPVRDYRQANEHRLLTEYTQLLSIPNVASDIANIRKNADYLIAEMEKR
ncbi:MAG TPA: hypothetical protein VJL58_07530, partial [Pyrinomonadaceae bacterium]|nr:hypothetical protein [Pyrinomonadaceae bacterium]